MCTLLMIGRDESMTIPSLYKSPANKSLYLSNDLTLSCLKINPLLSKKRQLGNVHSSRCFNHPPTQPQFGPSKHSFPALHTPKNMASLQYTTYDVFTDKKFTGNPLAVCEVPQGVTLTQEQKQSIAIEFNYSETTFLHPCSNEGSEVPEWPLDIFTVKTELPFAGHPTIGTACHVLSKTGKTQGRFKVKAGIIDLEYKDGVAKASIPHNTHIHTSTDLTATAMLNWQSGLKPFYPTTSDLPLAAVSPVKGMNFAVIQLRSLEELAAVTLPGTEFNFSLDASWSVGPCFSKFYVKMPDQGDGVQRLRTRMIEGSFEDPATGSACCGLAAYLVLKDKVQDGTVKFEILQAVEIGRPSEIGVEVKVKDGEIKTVVLSGKSVRVMEGKIFYE